jgi:hypothetical protein
MISRRGTITAIAGIAGIAGFGAVLEMISRGLEATVISIDPPVVKENAIVRLVPEFPAGGRWSSAQVVTLRKPILSR